VFWTVGMRDGWTFVVVVFNGSNLHVQQIPYQPYCQYANTINAVQENSYTYH
jgi:hypothetical protein